MTYSIGASGELAERNIDRLLISEEKSQTWLEDYPSTNAPILRKIRCFEELRDVLSLSPKRRLQDTK
jgi:hypothetical protein